MFRRLKEGSTCKVLNQTKCDAAAGHMWCGRCGASTTTTTTTTTTHLLEPIYKAVKAGQLPEALLVNPGGMPKLGLSRKELKTILLAIKDAKPRPETPKDIQDIVYGIHIAKLLKTAKAGKLDTDRPLRLAGVTNKGLGRKELPQIASALAEANPAPKTVAQVQAIVDEVLTCNMCWEESCNVCILDESSSSSGSSGSSGSTDGPGRATMASGSYRYPDREDNYFIYAVAASIMAQSKHHWRLHRCQGRAPCTDTETPGVV